MEKEHGLMERKPMRDKDNCASQSLSLIGKMDYMVIFL